MKVALTGATGFIGRYIAREFMTAEDTLRAMVRPTSDSAFLKDGAAELLAGDFGDDDSLRKLVDGMDVVIHNGYWHDRNELQEPMKWFELNVLGSLKLLEYSRRAGVKRYLFISTGAVYGTVVDPDRPRDELTGAFPRGGYAAYNRAVEVYVDAYRNEFDMTGSTSVRLCGRNIGVHPKIENSAYIDIVKAALAGEDVHVGGEDQFDCCADTARNLRLLAGLPLEEVEEVYCFTDDVYPMREIARAIVRGTCSKSKVVADVEARTITPTANKRIRKVGGTFSGLTGIEAYAGELAKALG
ncbi:MAG TPA: NAD-dependent epimerase/dehydratase family protein [Planctomycetota bacterium]|nr:NAD-dependent epimerase/dehydratase family protein [Planctomycetota bacterium]